LMMPLPMNEQVSDTQGHYYKQYHDETAGYTLQNQYTAAYKRWLDLEADYEAALIKFKDECKDAGVKWRTFLAKAKRQQEVQDDAGMILLADTMDAGDEINEKVVPDDEEPDNMLMDDELMRLVGVLLTIRANCDFAKDVMSRIQNEINEITQLEDERHKEATSRSDASVESKASSAAESIRTTGKSKVKKSSQRIKAQSLYSNAQSRSAGVDQNVPASSVYISARAPSTIAAARDSPPFVSETNPTMTMESTPDKSVNKRSSKIGSISELGSLSRVSRSRVEISGSSPKNREGDSGGGCKQM
ncbi:MAG: hypothetical protein SGARI_004720, partial [Bacillariaceae sp.]